MKRFGFTIAILLCATAAWAQGQPASEAGFGGELLAITFNAGLTAAVVELLLRKGMPILRKQFPWFLPILSMIAAPGIAYITQALSGALGHPVDLSPITAVLTGSLASSAFKVVKEAQGS